MSVQRIAALDIGGTRIKACLFENETLLQSEEADTPAKEGAQALLKTAGDLLEPFLPFEAVGVSTAGQVDPDAGTIRYANENLPGYTGTDVRGYFQQRFSVPCAVMNDAYAAALGEGAYGAARGHVQRILRRDAEARNQRIGCAHAAVQALVLADVGIAQHRDAVQAVVVVRAVQLLGFLHDGLFEFRIRHPQNAEYVFLFFNLHDRFLLVSFSAESRPSGGPPLPHA